VKKKIIIITAITSLVLFLDLWTKHLAVENLCRPMGEYTGAASCMSPMRVVHVIHGFFSLRYVENKGAAWGMGRNLSPGLRGALFVGVSGLAVILLFYFMFKARREQVLLLAALSFVLGGALGNLSDRIRYGYVVDFVEWYIGNYRGRWHWPTFNVADAAIVVGIALLAIEMFSASRREAIQESQAQKET